MGSKSSKHGKNSSTKQTRNRLSTSQRAAPGTGQLSTSQRAEPVTDQLSTSQRAAQGKDQLPISPDTNGKQLHHGRELGDNQSH